MRPLIAALVATLLLASAACSPPPAPAPPPPHTPAVYTPPPPRPEPQPTLTDEQAARALLQVIWDQRSPQDRDQVCDYYRTSPNGAVSAGEDAAQGRVSAHDIDQFLASHCRDV